MCFVNIHQVVTVVRRSVSGRLALLQRQLFLCVGEKG